MGYDLDIVSRCHRCYLDEFCQTTKPHDVWLDNVDSSVLDELSESVSDTSVSGSV